MDLRVFFCRKFVVGQGRERSIAREFLEKMRKSKKKERASEGGMRQTEGTRVDGEHHPYSEGAEQGKSTCFII